MSTTAALWPAGVAYVAAGGCPARPLRVLRCSPRKSFGIDRHHQAVPELGAADGAGQSAIIERGGQRRAAESRGDRILDRDQSEDAFRRILEARRDSRFRRNDAPGPQHRPLWSSVIPGLAALPPGYGNNCH